MRDKKHLSKFGKFVCLGCGSTHGVVAHHLLTVSIEYLRPKAGTAELLIPKYTVKGFGVKSSDEFTMPLCNKCHARPHYYGSDEKFLEEVGISMKKEEICLTIYNNRSNIKWVNKFIRGLRDVQSCGVSKGKRETGVLEDALKGLQGFVSS